MGTPHSLTDSLGGLVYSCTYNAYGQVQTETQHQQQERGLRVETNLRFQGQYADEETGLFYNLNRYYDPGLGRYLTADPIKLIGGLNQYRYCHNPINWIDPNGLLDIQRSGTEGISSGSRGYFDTSGMQQRVQDVRSGLPSDYKRSGNVAVADIDVLGVPSDMAAHSGIDVARGGVVGRGSGNFETLSIPDAKGSYYDRSVDSEYKILDNVSDILGDNKNATGNVNIFTERKACDSCLKVATDFHDMYPNIDLRIMHNNDNVVLPPRKEPPKPKNK